MIPVGTYIDQTPERMKITTDDLELRPHIGTPWIRQAVMKSLELERPPAAPSGQAEVDPKYLKRHSLIVGLTDSGKSRFATHLAIEQLKDGCSLVFIDPKDQTVIDVLAALEREKIRPERVTAAFPTHGHPPSWNPLDAQAMGVKAEDAADQLVEVLFQVHGDANAPRWPGLLRKAFLLAAAQGLTLYEVSELLTNTAYRTAILKRPPIPDITDRDTYAAVVKYFTRDYAVMAKQPNNETVTAAITRLDPFINSKPFLRSMLCSKRPSYRFDQLWTAPKPQVFIAHLNKQNFTVPGAKVMGGLLIKQLITSCQQHGGKGGNSVILFLDEIAFTQDFLGDQTDDLFNMMRSYDLHVVAACQFLNLVNPKLRDSLSRFAVKAYFNLDEADTDDPAHLAALRSPVSLPKEAKLSVSNRRAGVVDLDKKTYRLRDATGGPFILPMDNEAEVMVTWAAVQEMKKSERLPFLEKLLELHLLPPWACIMVNGKPRHVIPYLNQIPETDWELTGPEPLGLVIQYPHFKVSTVREDTIADKERVWEDKLSNQAQRHMTLIAPPSKMAYQVEVMEVPDGALSDTYLNDVLAKGQSPAEVDGLISWRNAQIEALTAPTPEPEPAPAAKPAGKPRRALPADAVPEPGVDDDF